MTARVAAPHPTKGPALSDQPWWVLVLLLAGAVLVWRFATDDTYHAILGKILLGLPITLAVTAAAYAAAIVIGLVAGLGRLSRNALVYNTATLYVQSIRGVPILVQIFVVAFVVLPAAVGALNAAGQALAPLLGPDNPLATATNRAIPMGVRATAALAIAYGGYEAETFRAGIQSIERGQLDAARSLGMTGFQALRFVILPQAVRRILPPLGNDLIAMLKDSSLVSVLGVNDLTQKARLHASASFQYPPTYYTLAFIYLVLTLVLAMVVKAVEQRMEPT